MDLLAFSVRAPKPLWHSDELDQIPCGGVSAETYGIAHKAMEALFIDSQAWIPAVKRFSAAVENERRGP